MGTEILSPCMNDATLPHELTWIQSLPEVPNHLHEHDTPNVKHSSTSPLVLENPATPLPPNNPLHNSKTQGTPIDLPQWIILNPSKASDDNMAPAEMRFRSPRRVEPCIATHRQIANGADDEHTQGASLSSIEAPGIGPKSPKKTFFDGVLITSRAPKSTRPRSASATRSRASTISFTLLDALQRTFDANNRSSLEDDDVSSIPQTDPEAVTDDEGVITRPLLSPLKRRFLRHQAAQSDNDTTEVTTAFPDGLVKKRVKSIPYDSMPEVIDAELGTVRAPVQLGKVDELKDDDEAGEIEAVWDETSDVLVDSDGGSPQKRENTKSRDFIDDRALPLPFFQPPLLSSALIATAGLPRRKVERTAIIIPHVSMHHRFQRKLHSLFGEDAIVRMDRGARPRKNSLDYVHEPAYPYHDDIATHPTTPEASEDSDDSPLDNTPPAPVDNAQASTPVTPMQERAATAEYVSADLPPMPRRLLKRRASQEMDADTHTSAVHHHDHGPSDMIAAPGEMTHRLASANKRQRLDFDEVQLQSWISNLQRLLKGKIQFTEEV
ncbi:hypothetical protein EDD16DRAFT_127592 [Pisolithus croceorrhizus]|nr:hypothetical protein EDD16DRAFT_127592 [Pisolithus croceorrhizus]